MMKKHTTILILFLTAALLTCCLTGCDEQSGQTTAVGDSNESAAESETNSAAGNGSETGGSDVIGTIVPFPNVDFVEKGTLSIAELSGYGEDEICGVDEEYIYFIHHYGEPRGNMGYSDEKIYRISHRIPGEPEVIANYSAALDPDSGIYNGDYYYIGSGTDLRKYTADHPEEPEILYSFPEEWRFPSYTFYNRHLVIEYKLPSQAETIDGWTLNTIHLALFDLESGTLKEIAKFDQASRADESRQNIYIGDRISDLTISGEHITWSQQMLNNEPYDSDEATCYYFQYSFRDSSIRRLFRAPRAADSIWGNDQAVIVSERANRTDSTQRRAKIYFVADGTWYEHAIPDESVWSISSVHQVAEDQYTFHRGDHLYLYDLTEHTYRVLNLAVATNAPSGSDIHTSYYIYFHGDSAFCQLYVRGSRDTADKYYLYQIDLAGK